jgi:hypothetical protein
MRGGQALPTRLSSLRKEPVSVLVPHGVAAELYYVKRSKGGVL